MFFSSLYLEMMKINWKIVARKLFTFAVIIVKQTQGRKK